MNRPKKFLKREDGGVIDTVKEMYDLRETYPTQFENAVEGLKGELGKIYNFWKETFGFRRGGHVGFRK